MRTRICRLYRVQRRETNYETGGLVPALPTMNARLCADLSRSQCGALQGWKLQCWDLPLGPDLEWGEIRFILSESVYRINVCRYFGARSVLKQISRCGSSCFNDPEFSTLVELHVKLTIAIAPIRMNSACQNNQIIYAHFPNIQNLCDQTPIIFLERRG